MAATQQATVQLDLNVGLGTPPPVMALSLADVNIGVGKPTAAAHSLSDINTGAGKPTPIAHVQADVAVVVLVPKAQALAQLDCNVTPYTTSAFAQADLYVFGVDPPISELGVQMDVNVGFDLTLPSDADVAADLNVLAAVTSSQANAQVDVNAMFAPSQDAMAQADVNSFLEMQLSPDADIQMDVNVPMVQVTYSGGFMRLPIGGD